MDVVHKPVLLREATDALGVVPGGWYIDATLGLGGHTLEVLRRGGNIVGIDVDPEALEVARKRFEESGIDEKRFVLVKGNFRDIKNLLPASRGEQTDTKFKGILFDLGVSSLQLDTPERGFSFGKVGPLDMRMDPNLSVLAKDLLKGLNKGELYELFTKLGEEKLARAVARALVRAGEIDSTTDLAALVERVYRQHGVKRTKVHPATRVFQALRVAVNDELNAFKEALPQALNLINKNGHIVVISFHSLEDRITKNSFREWEDQGFGQVLTKKPLSPSQQEILRNPRSRSAKLRVFEKQ